MADTVVIDEGIEDSATTMNTIVVDYKVFEGHTYRESSHSMRKNETLYNCNKYRLQEEETLWGTRRQSLNVDKKPGEKCPGTLVVKHGCGMSGGDFPYIKVEHTCMNNCEETSAVARGVADYRPQLERISPNFESGNFPTTNMIEEILREFKIAENNDKNLWHNITGGNNKRKWIPNFHTMKHVTLKVIIEKALSGYIKIVQERYPNLKYVKVGALKSLPRAESQYEGHGKKLHTDYPQSVEEFEPRYRPVSIIVALNSFNFMYLNDRTSKESEIRETTVYPGEMVMFTNHCLHSGGKNNTDEEQIRLFAYLVSHESHFPPGEVTTWDWQRGDDDPLISKPSSLTSNDKRQGTNQTITRGGRVAGTGKIHRRS